MSIEISDALKDGFRRSASRNGGVLAIGYLLVTAVYGVGYIGLYFALVPQLSSVTTETTTSLPSLGVPVPVAGVLFLAGLLLMTYFNVVAFRTFVDGARSSFPPGTFSRNVPAAIANMVAGGITLGIISVVLVMAPAMVGEFVGVGALSFLGVLVGYVAVLFLSISLAFMPMYIAVEDDSFIAAIGNSWRLTSGNRLSLFLLYLLLVVLIGVSMIPIAIAAVVLSAVGGALVAGLLFVAAFGFVTVFQLAVLAAAFQQLRDGATSGQGGAATGTATSPV